VPASRHQTSGQHRPAPQAFTLSAQKGGNSQHFASSGKTWPEACTYSYQMRSAADEQIEQEEVMFDKTILPSRGLRVVSADALGIALAVFSAQAFSAQDKYTLRVPNGLAFSDFRGYENWQVVAVSQTEDLLKVMVANPTMIDA
jgi:hypothetical protein